MHAWNEKFPSNILNLQPSISLSPNVMTSYNEVSLTTGGQPVRIADCTVLTLEVICTDGVRGKIRHIAVHANGYELFSCRADG
jgi:hypothetical protein